MSKALYNKLVRDNIPKIIEETGYKPTIRILNDKEYQKSLECKLQEEVTEYLESSNIEELADILEVIYALTQFQGYTIDELISIYQKKNKERGGFDKRIFLISKE